MTKIRFRQISKIKSNQQLLRKKFVHKMTQNFLHKPLLNTASAVEIGFVKY